MTDDSAVPGWDEVRAAGMVPPVGPAVLDRTRELVRSAAEAEAGDESGAVSARARRRRRSVFAGLGTAAAAAAVAVVLVLVGGDAESPTNAQPAPSAEVVTGTGPLPDGGAAGCVESYGRQTLRNRAFAFDGTVVAIGPLDGDGLYRAVTLEVHEWFRGDGGAEITVAMADGGAPSADPSSESGPAYGIGTRVLASGEPRWGGEALDEPIVWSCGFSRYYDEATAAQWREALAQP